MPCSIWAARTRAAQPIEKIRVIPAMTRPTIESADSNPIPVPASGAETHQKTFRGFLRYGCFIHINNPSRHSIELVGAQGSAADPKGERHPLRSQPIAPGTFIKLIFPPPRPTIYEAGPHFGFGFIVGRGGSPFYDSFYGPYGSAL